MKHEFGVTGRDKITGFTGIITGWTTYISGCSRVLLAPPVTSEGKLVEGEWFDEQRIDVVAGDRIVLDNSSTPGADRDAPKR